MYLVINTTIMTSKFIKIENNHINPVFITKIEDATNHRIVHTMDGSKAYVKNTVEEILDMIKKSEMFTITTK